MGRSVTLLLEASCPFLSYMQRESKWTKRPRHAFPIWRVLRKWSLKCIGQPLAGVRWAGPFRASYMRRESRFCELSGRFLARFGILLNRFFSVVSTGFRVSFWFCFSFMFSFFLFPFLFYFSPFLKISQMFANLNNCLHFQKMFINLKICLCLQNMFTILKMCSCVQKCTFLKISTFPDK